MIFARTRLALVVVALAVLSPIVVTAQSTTHSASGQSPLLLRNPSLSRIRSPSSMPTMSGQSAGRAAKPSGSPRMGMWSAGPFFLARRIADRLLRASRWQHRCLRHSVRGRRAASHHMASGRQRSGGLDAATAKTC